MPALAEAPNPLEVETLGELDPDKLAELAECLFMLNGRRFGPIPGFYVVVALKKQGKWCVGQLSADRAKPLRLFDDLVFASPEEARAHAEAMRSADEDAPRRG